jgi:hypothetical protein
MIGVAMPHQIGRPQELRYLTTLAHPLVVICSAIFFSPKTTILTKVLQYVSYLWRRFVENLLVYLDDMF